MTKNKNQINNISVNYEIMNASRSQSHVNQSPSHSYYNILQAHRSESPISNQEISLRSLKRGNFILRQELNSYTPEFSAKCAMIFNSFLSAIFLMIGVILMISSGQTIQYGTEYTDCSVSREHSNLCEVAITINETMLAPVYLYYHLENFHLNHRNLVKSKIWSQLRGETHIDTSNNSRCDGAKFVSEMFDNDTSRYKTYWNKTLKADDYANPCGLVAKSLFNDTFRLQDKNKEYIFINETEIANFYEKTKFFKRHPNYTDVQWIDVENEHFIVWMSMETYSSFRKLWGRIEVDLEPGNYTFIINENYNSSQYLAKKFIYLSTSSNIGSASFYGYLLVIAAGYCAFIVFILWVLHVTNINKKFDYNFIKWK